MTRLKVKDIQMVALLHLLAKWHGNRFHVITAFGYHTRAYNILCELKEEEQPAAPAARPVPSTCTALQSIGGSVKIRNLVPLFITQYRQNLIRLKDDFLEFAWGTTDEDFLIRMVYVDYFLYYTYYIFAIAILVCLSITVPCCAYIKLFA